MSALTTTIDTLDAGAFAVCPSGRLDFDAAAGFQRALEESISAIPAPKRVIVDCSDLSYVSSAGLRAFLVAARAAKSGGVEFSVCSLAPSVQQVFKVSGFNRIIAEHADRAAALAAST